MPRRMSTAKRAKTMGSILTGLNAVVLGMAEIVDCVADHAGKCFSGPYGYIKPLPFVKSRGALGLLEAPPAPLRKLGLKG